VFRVREERTFDGAPVVSESDSSSRRGNEPHNLTLTFTVPKDVEGVDTLMLRRLGRWLEV
jgi:hypothetical protein